ncbi:MAG: thiamine-binding protein [Nocardioides sp.]
MSALGSTVRSTPRSSAWRLRSRNRRSPDDGSCSEAIEGEWDEVMAVVKRAVDVVAEVSPRVGLVLKADIRPGWDGQLTAKVERVERLLEG